jgi:hypothetical protein
MYPPSVGKPDCRRLHSLSGSARQPEHCEIGSKGAAPRTLRRVLLAMLARNPRIVEEMLGK